MINGICGLEIVDGVALVTNLKFINKKVGFCMYFIHAVVKCKE